MSKTLNITRSTKKKILLVVANPAVSSTLHEPVGFWASELIHPWYEFREVGYELTIASPKGGKVEFDDLSDPRHPSRYSADDVLSMGFINTPELMALLDNTPAIADLKVADFDALVVCGGQSPMFTFPQDERLHRFIAEFYEAEKITAIFCHATCALLYVKLSDGTLLAKDKVMTGYADVEEDNADRIRGQKNMPFRIEDEAKKLGINYVQAGFFKEFAIRDGRLITGQQQYSGRATAQLVIEALGL